MRPRSVPVVLLGLSLCAACRDSSPDAAAEGDTTGASPTSLTAADGESGAADTMSGGSAADSQGDDGDPPPDDFPTDGFLGGFFPIGVFGQPAYALESWVGVGCNTMLGTPQDEDLAAWDEEAQRLGLAMIREPVGAPSEDAGRTDVLAWLLPDEPDVEANNGACGGNCVSLVESLAEQWRAADPERKIFVNVAGPNVLLASACDYCNGPGDEPPVPECHPENDQCYPRIFDAADWLSHDLYPVTGWLPSEDLRDDITIVGEALDRIRGWSDKPLFVILEISDQRLGFEGTGGRGPTPDEYRAQVWHAIIHGARGIFYFPQAFNPFEFENVEPDVLDELIVQHGLIGELAPLLQSSADPDGIAVDVDAPLEVTWRQTEANAWVFVLNTADAPSTATIRVDGVDGDARVYGEERSVSWAGGAITDEFAPYALHVYVLPRA